MIAQQVSAQQQVPLVPSPRRSRCGMHALTRHACPHWLHVVKLTGQRIRNPRHAAADWTLCSQQATHA